MEEAEDAEYEVDEDAGQDAGGGNFADVDSVFARNNFEDDRSIFATPRTPPVDTSSSTVTAAQEQRRYETVPSAAQEQEKRLLVCRITSHGVPVVAQFRGKNRLEKWRTPTSDEMVFLREQGKLVKGGLAEVPVAEASSVSPLGTLFKVGVGAALLYGAYRIYKYVKADEANVETVEV